jgi:acylphosphatase
MTQPVDTLCRHAIIRGQVQGVGFRYWTQRAALTYGLEGFVRNRRDGSVEALFCGAPPVVAGMLEDCRRGPPGASVTSIDQSEAEPALLQQRRPAERFSILPTL